LERSSATNALDQGALLALRAGRGVAADLPVAMDRPHRALRAGHGQAKNSAIAKLAANLACGGQACARQAAEAAGKRIAALCGRVSPGVSKASSGRSMIFPWQC